MKLLNVTAKDLQVAECLARTKGNVGECSSPTNLMILSCLQNNNWNIAKCNHILYYPGDFVKNIYKCLFRNNGDITKCIEGVAALSKFFQQNLGLVSLNTSDYDKISSFLQKFYSDKPLYEIFSEYQVCCKTTKCKPEGGCFPGFCTIVQKINEYNCCSLETWLSQNMASYRNKDSAVAFCYMLKIRVNNENCATVCQKLFEESEFVNFVKNESGKPEKLFVVILEKLEDFCSDQNKFFASLTWMKEEKPFACREAIIGDKCVDTGTKLNLCCSECSLCSTYIFENICDAKFSITQDYNLQTLKNNLALHGVLKKIEENVKKRSVLSYLEELANLDCSSN